MFSALQNEPWGDMKRAPWLHVVPCAVDTLGINSSAFYDTSVLFPILGVKSCEALPRVQQQRSG